MRVLNIYKETISDGYGLRYSIYLSGCNHECPFCHNENSWNPDAGILLDDTMLSRIIREINSNPLLDGITLSGGDPFYNPEELLFLLKKLKKETGKHITCYTGYTIEFLLEDSTMKECLRYIDMLIDGPFIKKLYDPNLLFRGSSNQRLIKNPFHYKDNK